MRPTDKARNLVRISEHALVRIFNKMADGVLIIDPDWHILYANEAAARYLDLSSDDEKVREDLIPKLASRFVLTTELGTVQKEDLEGSLVFQASHLPNMSYGMTLSLYMSRPTEEGWRILLMRDVTEEQKESAFKHSFLGLVSHKLRTPITVLQMVLKNFSRGSFGALNKKQQGASVTMQRRVTALEHLVGKLISFTELQNQDVKRDASIVDVIKLTADVCERYACKEAAKPLQISWKGKVDDGRVLFNERLLGSVIKNIVENAVKFSKKPEVHINIAVSKIPATGEIEMNIHDDGPGIPPAVQKQAFQTFTQRDDDFTGNVEGMGLGLPIVYHLMNLFGGDASLKSSPKDGTTISLVFPPLGQ